MTDRRTMTAEERAEQRVEERKGLMIHSVVFVLVNALLWAQDLIAGGGLDWAYWTTIAWGIGLAIHASVYVMSNSSMDDRAYERFLAEERAKDEARTHHTIS